MDLKAKGKVVVDIWKEETGMHQGIGQQEHRDSHSPAYIHIWMDHN